MDICISLNKSLPGINSDFLSTSIDQENRSVCLAAYQSSSIVFQPVIKQINKDGNITALPSNTGLSLPFICGANPGTRSNDLWFFPLSSIFWFTLIYLSFLSIQRCMTYLHVYRQKRHPSVNRGKLVLEKIIFKKKHDFETISNKASTFRVSIFLVVK